MRNRILIVILYLFCSLGCIYDPPEDSIQIVNNNKNSIVAYCSCFDSILISDHIYIPKENFTTEFVGSKMPQVKYHSFYPNYSIKAFGSGKIWSDAINYRRELNCDDNRIRIFIFNSLPLQNWEDLVRYKNFYKKITVAKEELDSCNWKVNLY